MEVGLDERLVAVDSTIALAAFDVSDDSVETHERPTSAFKDDGQSLDGPLSPEAIPCVLTTYNTS
uniref:Uncharacterized protein n=1 Tax=Parascaris equorum TaxID=6256 RepID=A0A914RSV5_PAREQ